MSETDMTTGSAPGPGWSRRRHPALVAALAVLALLLATACAVVVISPTAVPGTSAAERANDRVDAVTAAARKVTGAFLDVDYRDMDPRIAAVLALSTGTFKNQYTTAKVDLKAQAEQAKAVATGAVRYVGVGEINPRTAKVYVAADTKVSNAAIEQAKAAGKTVDDKRYYRFQLDLKKVGDRWLLDNLQFIS